MGHASFTTSKGELLFLQTLYNMVILILKCYKMDWSHGSYTMLWLTQMRGGMVELQEFKNLDGILIIVRHYWIQHKHVVKIFSLQQKIVYYYSSCFSKTSWVWELVGDTKWGRLEIILPFVK